jgi:prepilin-type processing-associated H-X9-DG protein
MNCHNQFEPFSIHEQGANFAMGDGSVRYISQTVSMTTFFALVTKGAGEVVGSID